MADLSSIIDAYLDGELEGNASTELERAIVSDREAALLFSARSVLHRRLRDAFAIERHRSSVAGHAVASAPAVRSEPFKLRPWMLHFAAAIVVVAGAAAIYVISGRAGDTTDAPDSSPIATLVWADAQVVGEEPLMTGQSLRPQTIQTGTGDTELVLTSGTTVTASGPTELRLESPMRVTLVRGRASFACPEHAKGFTVHLPAGARVVDLGTEFSVTVESSGRSRVEVIDGSVEVRSAEGRRLRCHAGEIASVDATGRVVPLDVAAYDFARLDASPFPGTPLAGQDGWVTIAGRGATVRSDADSDAGRAFLPLNAGVHRLHRRTDDAFAVTARDGSRMVIECDIRLGSTGRGARIGLIDDAGRALFEFGNNAPQGGSTSAWTLIDRRGQATYATDLFPHRNDAIYRLCATIDLAAYDGGGSFSLAVAPLGRSPAPVADMTDRPLHLVTGDGSRVNGLVLHLFNAGAVGDIRVISEGIDDGPNTHPDADGAADQPQPEKTPADVPHGGA